MLMHMAPSSPPVKRTLHLLKTPDILLAKDNRQTGNYYLDNSSERANFVWKDQSWQVGKYPGICKLCSERRKSIPLRRFQEQISRNLCLVP
jgi:hypothetical protein